MKNMKKLYRCNRKCSAEECEASPCALTTDIAFAEDPEDYIEIPNGAISAEDWAKLDEYYEKIKKEESA